MTEIRHRRVPGGSVRERSASPPHDKRQSSSADEDKKHASDKTVPVTTSVTDVAWTVALVLVSCAALITRSWALHHPGEVVFDEVHFGKFASYYLRREYYFDVHPPLGKLLLALIGYLVGYDGHYLFDNIGESYTENNVPYMAFRLWCAVCGAAVVPVTFLTLKEMGVSLIGAVFGAVLLVFDNALITQSRLILLDSMLMLFCVICVYCWVKFRKLRHESFTAKWWGWLAATGVALSLVTGVKMVGLFTVASVGLATLFDLWDLLDIRRGLTVRQFVRHFSARALCLIFLPFFLYLVPFYIHFAILTNSGPGDAFMSLKFQEGLEGNAVTSGSVTVMYGANITIQHTETKAFLHSHNHRYPLRYEDGRISTEGIQVNAYAYSDNNSLWEIVAADPVFYPPAGTYTPDAKEEEHGIRYVRNDDLVRLRHVALDRYLLTHDVASSLSSTNMEITTVDRDEADRRYNETLWRISMADSDSKEEVKSKKRVVRIINHEHNVAVYSDKNKLPDWGFGMFHTNGNKRLVDRNNNWKIVDVHHEKIVDGHEVDEPQKDATSQLSFLQKFVELQGLMLHHNAALTKPHPYSSSPGIWPFVVRGISFWEKQDGLKQIYLIGNPLVWWFVVVCVLFHGALWLVDRIALRRGMDDFGWQMRTWWDRAPLFLLAAWACHYVPFFLMGRMLFLHHYLPAFIFSSMLAAVLVDFVGRVILSSATVVVWKKAPAPSAIHKIILIAFMGAFIASFVYFAPYSYGSGLGTVDRIREHKWLSSWDLQYA